MSQSNNRVSYASIAGRSATNTASKSSCCSPEVPTTQVDLSVVDEEEYPPIGNTGAIKPKNDRKKIENIPNTLNIELPPENIPEKEENLPNLSQLSLDESSKTDSPRSKNDPVLSDPGVENNNMDSRPKLWASLFKKDTDNELVREEENPVSIVDETESQNLELEEEKVFLHLQEEPSCSRNTDLNMFPPPIEPYPMQYQMPPQMSYIQMTPMAPTSYAVPQYAMAPGGYTFVAAPPMVQPPYLQGYMPMDQTMMPVMQNLPYNAIAHPYQGMVYFQYENPMPAEAFQAQMPPVMPPVEQPSTPRYSRNSFLAPAASSNNASDQSSQKPSSNGDNWASAVETMRYEQKIANKMDLIICNRYQVYLKINRGSCGSVFAAVDLFDPYRRTYAIKFEDFVESRSNLVYEYETCSASEMNGYVFGNQNEGFARVYWMGQQYKYRILIMQLLGPSLENLFSFSMRQFSPETIYQLGNQMLNRIEHLHQSGFVHRDIKPENFAVGIGPLEKTIFLIDFGLSRRIRFNPDNLAIIRKDKSLVGTAKYASMNSHKGLQLGRRDDMESIAYILLEFMHGELPWKPENWRTAPKDVLYKNMLETKKSTSWSKYPEMNEWLSYIANLEFNEKPDYNYLRALLTRYRDNSFSKPQRVTPLSEHLASVSHTDGPSNSKKKSVKGTPQKMERDADHEFEWIVRRESCPNDRYSYECLYRWTLPYGMEPLRPPGDNPSNVFGYGFGEGGFA